MKVWAFIFLAHKFLSFVVAKLYHRCVILSMFYFFYAKDFFIGGISTSAEQNISLIFHLTHSKLKTVYFRLETSSHS